MIRRWWNRRKLRAFPPGAITFQLEVAREEFPRSKAGEALGIMEQFGFDALHVLHGTALEVARGAIVVCGAPGIGKSTVSRRLRRDGVVIPIEDGIMLAGEREGVWEILETGTLRVLDRMARISGFVRRVTGTRSSTYSAPSFRERSGKLELLRIVTDRLAFWLAVLSCRGGWERFKPRKIPLAALVFAVPDRGPVSHVTFRRGRGPERWVDPVGRVPAGVRLITVSALGPRSRVEESIERAILSATSNERIEEAPPAGIGRVASPPAQERMR